MIHKNAFERKQEAQEQFADVISVECPECGKHPGVLCDADGVWVHFGRFQLYDPQTYSLEWWPL